MKYDWLARDEGSRFAEEMSSDLLLDIDDIGGRRSALQFLSFETDEDIQSNDNSGMAEWPRAPRGLPAWAATMEDLGLKRPAGDDFMKVVDGVLDLVSDKSFTEIDNIFGQVRVERISADFLVALLRLTHSDKDHIGAWGDLFNRVRDELFRRPDVDAKLELTGLNDGNDTK